MIFWVPICALERLILKGLLGLYSAEFDVIFRRF